MGVKLEMFNNEADTVSFAAGETIFRSGEAADQMYVLLKGEVDIVLGEEVIETLGPGDPFGEMALIDQAPRIATAIAKSPVTLATVSEKRFLFMVQQTPYFSIQIMKVMADRLRRMNVLRLSGLPA
ncbi:MAG TPA: cyclic nucleotide-binding domain-containing protein [Usitatibacter sp.]|nr:cyclic nucleotide-binding domain-containing protein [Usitatibacter sp.]